MENANQAPPAGLGVRREPSSDPVKAQGILKSVSKKEKHAARVWEQRWGFLSRVRDVQEEEAQKLGMSLDEYRAGVRSVSCKPEKEISVDIDPSPAPLPPTSSGMIGRRAQCSLERFGPQVKTERDYPIRPPLPAGQIYDPYKQTMIFLGDCVQQNQEQTRKKHGISKMELSVEGDPISYKLPAACCEVTDDMWARPQQLSITTFQLDRIKNDTCSSRHES